MEKNQYIDFMEKLVIDGMTEVLRDGYYKYDSFMSVLHLRGSFKIQVVSGNVPIEMMDFSIRSFNCLYRAGYRTTYELCDLSDEELSGIRNIGRKCIIEIKEKMDLVRKDREKYGYQNYIGISFERNGQKVVKYYFDQSFQEMANDLYDSMISKESIFQKPYAPFLMNLLILKGYIFDEDVKKDYRDIARELNAGGFELYGNHLLAVIEEEEAIENWEN